MHCQTQRLYCLAAVNADCLNEFVSVRDTLPKNRNILLIYSPSGHTRGSSVEHKRFIAENMVFSELQVNGYRHFRKKKNTYGDNKNG